MRIVLEWWLSRVEEVARWLRPGNASGDEALRIKYVVGQVGVGLLVSALAVVADLLDGDPVSAAITAAFAGVLVGGLLLLRFGRVAFATVARVEQMDLIAFLILMHLQTEKVHVEQLYWFALVPMTSALMLGQRGAWGGMLFGTAGVAVAVALRALGFHLQAPSSSWVGQAIDIVQFLLAFTALATVFERVRIRHALEAERAAKARGMFLANVSHELRTPMNGVIGLAELLSTSRLEPMQREQLALLQRSGESMVALINDLLDLTKLEAGQFMLEQVSVSAQTVAADVRSLLAPSASARGGEHRARLRRLRSSVDPR